MAVRHRPDRPRAWQVYWINPRTGRRESASYATEQEARKADSLVKHRIRFEPESFSGCGEKEPAPRALTFADAFRAYCEERGIGRDGMRRMWYHMRDALALIGGMPVADVSAEDVRRVEGEFAARGIRQTTIHRYMVEVRATLRLAEARGWIDRAPKVTVRVGAGERIAPPTPDEIAAIHAAAGPHLRRVIILGSQLGMRVGQCELLRLRWEDVDFSRRVVRVPPARKNPDAAWREVPIRDGLLPVLRAWRDEDAALGLAHVVTWDGRPVKSIKKAWRLTLARAGITRRIRPYDLRHAFATELVSAGVDVATVARLMGHASPTMVLEHYRYVTDGAKSDAVERLPAPPTCDQNNVTNHEDAAKSAQ